MTDRTIINRLPHRIVVDGRTILTTKPAIRLELANGQVNDEWGFPVNHMDWWRYEEILRVAKLILADKKRGANMVIVSRPILDALYHCFVNCSIISSDSKLLRDALDMATAPDTSPDSVICDEVGKIIGVKRLMKLNNPC